MNKRAKLKRLVEKYPAIHGMTHKDFHEKYPRQDICGVEFYKVLRAMKETQEVEVASSKRKMDAIVERFRFQLAAGGIEAVAAYDHQQFMKETKTKVTNEWFQRLRRRFLKEQHEEDIPPVTSVNDAIIKTARRLMTLTQAAGLEDVRLEKGKLTARRMEAISFAI